MAFADDPSNTPGDPGNNQPDNPNDNQGDPAHQQGAKPNEGDPPADPSQGVFMIVGDRAYHTQDDVAKKLQHSDSHIATLESERKTDRERIQQLEAENARLNKIVDNMPGKGNGADPSGKGSSTENLSIEEIVQRTAQHVTAQQQQDRARQEQESNLTACEQKAKELYGDSYKDTIRQRGQELGMSGAQIDALGKESPNAFSRLFLNDEGVRPASPSYDDGGVNSAAIKQQQQGQGNDNRPVNVTKLRERDRISTVTERMKKAGIEY